MSEFIVIHRKLGKAISWACLFAVTSASAQDTTPEKRMPTNLSILKQNFRGIIQKSRLKDIAHFAGVRENQLVGYGLVVGLNGTGDTLASAPYTKESLTGMLERLGVNIRDGAVPAGKNVAAVMVTATLPPFRRQGTKIDISVSALGDAKDLKGGTLLVTPLLGADGQVYAVAQGALAVSAVSAQGRAAQVTKGVPTSAKITNGAIIEREVGFELAHLQSLSLTLSNPDFTTAERAAGVINEHFKSPLAKAIDSSTIQILIPAEHGKNLVPFMTEIEQLKVEPDQSAKVVIDDQNGVIVVNKNVKISPVALTHGSITIRVVESQEVSQPNPFTNVAAGPINIPTGSFEERLQSLKNKQALEVKSLNDQYALQVSTFKEVYKTLIESNDPVKKQELDKMELDHKIAVDQQTKIHLNEMTTLQQQQILAGIGKGGAQAPTPMAQIVPAQQATVTENTAVNVKEEKGKFSLLESGVSLEEFVDALNLLGTSPRDLTAILQSIKASGAMQAEIVVI
jgi:flagellar P-ring protein precursor FlgI